MKKQILSACIALATIAQPLQAKDFFSRLNDTLMEYPYYSMGFSFVTGIALTGLGCHYYYRSLITKNTIAITAKLQEDKQAEIATLNAHKEELEKAVRNPQEILRLNAEIRSLQEIEQNLQTNLTQEINSSKRYKTAVSYTLRCFAGMGRKERILAENLIGTHANGQYLAPLLILRFLGIGFNSALKVSDVLPEEKLLMAGNSCLQAGVLTNEMQVDAHYITSFNKKILQDIEPNCSAESIAEKTIDHVIRNRCGFIRESVST